MENFWRGAEREKMFYFSFDNKEEMFIRSKVEEEKTKAGSVQFTTKHILNFSSFSHNSHIFVRPRTRNLPYLENFQLPAQMSFPILFCIYYNPWISIHHTHIFLPLSTHIFRKRRMENIFISPPPSSPASLHLGPSSALAFAFIGRKGNGFFSVLLAVIWEWVREREWELR